MVLFFLLQSTETIELIKQLGFPIAIAVLLLWFLYQVWKYTVKKIDEKDLLLKESAENRRAFNDRLLLSQEKINDTMQNVNSSLTGLHNTLISKKQIREANDNYENS